MAQMVAFSLTAAKDWQPATTSIPKRLKLVSSNWIKLTNDKHLEKKVAIILQYMCSTGTVQYN